MTDTTANPAPAAENQDVLRKIWRTLPLTWRRSIRTSVHPALLETVFRSTPSLHSAVDYGLLTVVVPVYNVEAYLDECLQSIIRQTYERLEVLIVDDGSSDDSVRIARGFSRADRRVRIIQQTNAGLGAARNTGIREARGEFITFADSDDIVPLRAYEGMMRSLHRSGSDFAVGSLTRLTGKQRAVPLWAAEVHKSDRIGVTLGEFPEILQDVFAWNKVFRRSFWDENVRSFPEGVLYEDQEATARAYARSSGFDVLSEVVYDWRIRQDRSSITQQKDNIVDLADRLLVASRLLEFMSGETSDAVFDSWLAKVLGPDLGLYYAQVPRVGDEYWSVLQESGSKLASHARPTVWSQMSVHHRILVDLLVRGNRADFERVVMSNTETGTSFPLLPDEGAWHAVPGYLEELESQIDPALLLVEPEMMKVQAGLSQVGLSGPTTLTIVGHAYLPGVRAADKASSVRCELVEAQSGVVLPAQVESLTDSRIDIGANDAWTSYEESGFRANIDLATLREATPDEVQQPEWFVRVSLQLGDTLLQARLGSRQTSGAGATFPLLPVQGDRRFVCRFSAEFGFSLLTVSHRRFAERVALTGRTLTITPRMAPGERVTQLVVECPGLRLYTSARPVADGENSVFNVSIPDLPARAGRTKQHIWKIRAETQDGKLHNLAWGGTDAPLLDLSNDGEALRLRTTGYGYLELHERRWQVVAERFTVSDDERSLVVLGKASYADGDGGRIALPMLVLANGRSVIQPSSTQWLHDGNGFKVVFPIKQQKWGSAVEAPESGTYTLRCLTANDGSTNGAYWVPVSRVMESELPHEFTLSSTNIRVTRTAQAAALALQFGPPLLADERGKLMQSRLQRNIPDLIKHPVETGTVLFEAFNGKTIGDSGLGLFNEMMRRGDHRLKYWTVRDLSQAVPEGARAVVMFSREWYRLLHTAEFVVNNNNFPYYYRKNPGQKYIQTWHGTPLKRIGNDVASSQLSLPYIKLMKKEAQSWDYLLAQNPFAEEVLPRAFGFDGMTLGLGYPRNDALVGESAKLRRTEVRKALGLREDQKAILYAPTWRDNVRTSDNQYDLVNYLDVEKAGEILGDGHAFMLRGHHNVSGQRYTTGLNKTIDVTAYPDVNDLYLAADILVTDYSSVMFDFCVTGKAIYFLTPDLEEYRDKVRGFYFDFEGSAPGPLARTTEELAESISKKTAEVHFAGRYKAFRDRFSLLDDGRASERVYDAIWTKY
ncbi:CDP-glycerol glycerophosphotransferase [Arthrobacter ginsengisoli]|uniref:CDP-glycerol glycerophosphotransferase n=1 Tax=Arthrobacter ginsengisoli TaxID=1356565 RepID=A0ABU1UFI9_9MICC|nr:bifunctional glycosyltransferase family 2 protein/CDP-glycerol:glycerophosphate glycerophosphotransferase [Arthrobacter ginsengisoli]MDR7083952.1 CDP-glycerol glycerophosphotransferase [Arthrobacter ginsengisoli]